MRLSRLTVEINFVESICQLSALFSSLSLEGYGNYPRKTSAAFFSKSIRSIHLATLPLSLNVVLLTM